MVKIDLITGFLGSGKTTFIKKYAKYLVEHGENIGILENDYGAVNVDMMLLQDMESEHCTLEMVAGGCDADCHRRRFKTKLIAMGMVGYDRVLIEPSGIFDIDEFFDVLHEEPLDRWYEIGNVIAIVDASLEPELSSVSTFMLASQIANAGIVVISKLDGEAGADRNPQAYEKNGAVMEAGANVETGTVGKTQVNAKCQKVQHTIDTMNQALVSVQCKRAYQAEQNMLIKDWRNLADQDYEAIKNSGYELFDYVKKYDQEKNGFQSLYYMNMEIELEELKHRIETIFSDPLCGNVFRIKGFMKTANGTYVDINATRREISVTEIARGQDIIIVIGEELNAEHLNDYFPERDRFLS